MSTRVTLAREYPYDVSAFAAALADPEFHRVKLDVDGSGRIEVLRFAHERGSERGADTDRVEVVLRQPVPPGQVPGVVERLLDGVLVIERTERWRLGHDRCDGETRVAVPRTPITATGTMSVRGSGAACARLAVDLDVTVAVPLLGGGIERAVITGIRGLTGTEHERISTWLAAGEPRDGDRARGHG